MDHGDGDGDASSHAKEEMGMKMGMISPFSGAPGQQDLSPRVSRVSPPWRLRLVSGKLGCPFWGRRSHQQKTSGRRCCGPIWGPHTRPGNLATWATPFWASWPSSFVSCAHGLSPEEKLTGFLSFHNLDTCSS